MIGSMTGSGRTLWSRFTDANAIAKACQVDDSSSTYRVEIDGRHFYVAVYGKDGLHEGDL